MSIMSSARPDTRTRILEVASRLFAEKGFDNTSTRDIAAELNIASPSLYHHFPSKEAILVELLREPMAHVKRAAEDARHLTGHEKGLRIVEGLIGALELHHGIVVVASENRESISSSLKESVGALELTVFGILAAETHSDSVSIRFTMAVGAVQAVVRELSRKAADPIEFVQRLRSNRSQIVNTVMGILFEGYPWKRVDGN